MNRVAVINVVGLCNRHIGQDMPFTQSLCDSGERVLIDPAFPAVTCTAQSDYLTGKRAASHGVVGNGWYNRDLCEVQFWKQSNQLVQAPKIWESLQNTYPDFTCSKIFWWYNMYSGADWSLTPRPIYPADGRKVFDIYTTPSSLRYDIKKALGDFPFPGFWGPAAGINTLKGSAECVSQWIANSAMWIEENHSPSLSMVYLPHLDYNLQRLGPHDPTIKTDLQLADRIIKDLVTFYGDRGVQSLILSEYGITQVDHPIHLNRVFREAGWLAVREELGLEILDPGASKAFAVADHQVAHIYINDKSILPDVKRRLETVQGINLVLDDDQKIELGINHERAGDLIVVSDENAWFTYYYWLDDDRAPDFARTVDIHRKPGFDPVELFIDPEINFPKIHILKRILQKKIGLRMLMDVIPLDATLINGSHGCRPSNRKDWPILIGPKTIDPPKEIIRSTEVHRLILKMFD